MDKKKFERIITDLTEDWLYDTVEPVRQSWRRPDGTKATPGRRKKHSGEEREVNPTGELHIVKWLPRTSVCLRCDQRVEDHEETIDIKKKTVRCKDCGEKYSLDVLNPFKYNK
jgi:hypothetical protein